MQSQLTPTKFYLLSLNWPLGINLILCSEGNSHPVKLKVAFYSSLL